MLIFVIVFFFIDKIKMKLDKNVHQSTCVSDDDGEKYFLFR